MRYLQGLFCALSLSLSAAASAQPLTQKQVSEWREDLRFMANEIRTRHANYTHKVDASAFDAAVADLNGRIPALQRNQIIVGLMKIAAMIGDGHTRVDPRKDAAFQFPSLPLKLYDFDDGIYVRAVRPGEESMLGARVEAVGGIPIEEVRKRIAPLISGDNRMQQRTMVPLYIAMPDVLHAVGLAANRENASLTLVKNGRRWTTQVRAAQIDPLWPPDTDISLVTPEGWVDARKGTVPTWLQEPLTLHRLIGIPERGLVYAQLNQGVDYKGESLDTFGERIAALAKEQNPRALVFDLRLNFGGNGDMRHELIRQLIRAEDQDTQLFVLTGRGSFSATQFMLEDLARLSHGLLMGEPGSGSPTSYGDAYKSLLPNSHIAVRTSIVFWKEGQDNRPWTPIDIAVPYRFADYVAGRDAVLEAALAYKAQPSLRQQLNAAAKQGGPERAVSALAAYAADPAHRYADVAEDGLRAIEAMDDSSSALAASRWLAQHYREEVSPQVLYALLAEAVGSKTEALSAARAALALEPNNRQARSVLEHLAQ